MRFSTIIHAYIFSYAFHSPICFNNIPHMPFVFLYSFLFCLLFHLHFSSSPAFAPSLRFVAFVVVATSFVRLIIFPPQPNPSHLAFIVLSHVLSIFSFIVCRFYCLSTFLYSLFYDYQKLSR